MSARPVTPQSEVDAWMRGYLAGYHDGARGNAYRGREPAPVDVDRHEELVALLTEIRERLPEPGGVNDERIVGLTAERDKWQGRAEKAEAEADRLADEARVENGELRDALADMTRPRDGWRARYEALLADVERDRRTQTTFTDVLRALGRTSPAEDARRSEP